MRAKNLQSERRATLDRVVYVVDDDRDLRRSLHFLLGTRGVGVSPFADGRQFLGELSSLKPAPIILDLRMPQMDGIQVLHEIVSRQVKWPVIIVSGHGEVGVAVEALKLGASDFLEKPVSSTHLLQVIEVAFEELAREAAIESSRNEAVELLAALTPRELEVLRLLSLGRSNKQVAYDLSISPRTVEMHRANALRQLNVRTLVEAMTIQSAAKN